MSITWAVCKNEGTSTLFCSKCREVFNTVKIGEAAMYVKEIEEKHVCQEHDTTTYPPNTQSAT